MSIMTSFTWRALAKNRTRTVVSILGIALSCALLTAILTTVTSLENLIRTNTELGEGTWEIFEEAAGEQQIKELAESEHTKAAISSNEVGTARIDMADDPAPFLITVRTLPAPIAGSQDEMQKLVTGPKLVAGRLPESEQEILLPAYLASDALTDSSDEDTFTSSEASTQEADVQAEDEINVEQFTGELSNPELAGFIYGNIQLGENLNLAVGERVDKNGNFRSSYLDYPDLLDREGNVVIWNPDDAVKSEDGEAVAQEAGVENFDAYNLVYNSAESIEGAQEKSYTVVGFYEDPGLVRNEIGAGETNVVALTSSDARPGAQTSVWIETQGFRSRDELKSWAAELFGEEAYFLHSYLLALRGYTDSRPVWQSLWDFAFVLAGIIAVAAITLIYNSFAISVMERTRQFGLLSSLGASKYHLMRSVFSEAALMAALGIPLGIAAGIAGVSISISLTKDAFAALFAYDYLEGASGMGLSVRPEIIALVVLASFVVVFVSALIPSLRAGKVSAIDAVRQTQDIHLNKAAERALAKAAQAGKTPRASLAERVFGTPGLLAHRSLSRSGAKGRVVIASLAISVVLLVVSGALALYLSPLKNVIGSMNAVENPASIQLHLYGSKLNDESDRPSTANTLRFLNATKGQIAQSQDLASLFSCEAGYLNMVFPISMLSQDGRNMLVDDSHPNENASYTDGTSWAGSATVVYVEDSYFESYLHTSTGHSLADFKQLEEGGIPALAINQNISNIGDSYTVYKPFSTSGELSAYELPNKGNYRYSLLSYSNQGELLASYYGSDNEDEADVLELAVSDLDAQVKPIQVLGFVSDIPAEIASPELVGYFPSFILPESALDDRLFIAETAILYLDIISDISPQDATRTLDAALDKVIEELSVGSEDGIWSWYANNYAEEAETGRSIYHMLALFINLFALITMLIAIANVFNTLTNTIVLRTREFAVLESSGMDSKTFATMLFVECLRYAAWGFILGIIPAIAASFLLWKSWAGSFTMSFSLPWAHIGLAALAVVLVLALSVVYALQRSKKLNTIEALRADAI